MEQFTWKMTFTRCRRTWHILQHFESNLVWLWLTALNIESNVTNYLELHNAMYYYLTWPILDPKVWYGKRRMKEFHPTSKIRFRHTMMQQALIKKNLSKMARNPWFRSSLKDFTHNLFTTCYLEKKDWWTILLCWINPLHELFLTEQVIIMKLCNFFTHLICAHSLHDHRWSCNLSWSTRSWGKLSC